MRMQKISKSEFQVLENFLTMGELQFIQKSILKKINCLLSNENKLDNWKELLARYNSILKLHDKLADKKIRCLDEEEVITLMESKLSDKIHGLIGEYEITDEEEYGYPEMYWRIVRPNKEKDVGPLHADGWFWDINENWEKKYKNRERIKFWIAIETDWMKNGLKIVDNYLINSENKTLYEVVKTGGKYKPCIRKNVEIPKANLIGTKPSDAIMFGDRLLHAGAMNLSDKPRISLEFTCCRK